MRADISIWVGRVCNAQHTDAGLSAPVTAVHAGQFQSYVSRILKRVTDGTCLPLAPGPAKVPLFMLASAAETSASAPPPGTPMWRLAAANLAAGATAGCAVELGGLAWLSGGEHKKVDCNGLRHVSQNPRSPLTAQRVPQPKPTYLTTAHPVPTRPITPCTVQQLSTPSTPSRRACRCVGHSARYPTVCCVHHCPVRPARCPGQRTRYAAVLVMHVHPEPFTKCHATVTSNLPAGDDWRRRPEGTAAVGRWQGAVRG